MNLNPFIFGLSPSIPDSPYLDTETLYNQVGHNTGNLAFHHAIDNLLGPRLQVVDWSSDISKVPSSGKIGVVPCANQLGAHADFGGLASKFSALPCPLIAIGLGAQAGTDGKFPEVPKGTQDWVRAMADQSIGSRPNIGVRGQFTRDVLAQLGLADKVAVLGCPTLFINPDPNLGQKIATRFAEKAPERIAVASGHQRWKHLARIEESLVQMVTATQGSYVGQSPLEMVKLTRGEAKKLSSEALTECRDYICPSMNDEEFIRWTHTHGHVFFDVPAWMEHYRRFDFVVGTRIHGIMLGLQAGIPSLCIVHDSRTLELCQTMKVPHVMARDVIQGITRTRLLNLFKFDPDEFDANRSRLGDEFSNFFFENSILTNPAYSEYLKTSRKNLFS